jgi:hypothetical protein
MDIFFQDPDDPPLPPEKVHIRSFDAVPYPDGRRVKIQVEISPFQKRPSGEVSLQLATGEKVASASVIETMVRKFEMTLHLRTRETKGDYTAVFDLFYEHLPEEADNGSEMTYEAPERVEVDRAEMVFSVS